MKKIIPLALCGAILITSYSFTGIKKENTNITKKINKAANVIAKSGKKATKSSIKKNAQNDKNIVQKSEEEELPDVGKVIEEPVIERKEEEIRSIEQEEVNSTEQQVNSYETRLTSYYPNDGPGTGSITGSGLGPSNFEVNDKGWFTYQGKLVIATATPYLEKYGWVIYDGVHTFKYYDEVILNIDGIDYESIVVDSCGKCCKTDRIDLFVSNKESVKDTNIIVKMK